MTLQIFDVGSADGLNEVLAARLSVAIADVPNPKLALAGGATPFPAYAHFSASLNDQTRARLSIAPTDERLCPHDHPWRNDARLAEVFHGSRVDDLSAANPDCLSWPGFDAVVLGMGTDAHFASLFPGQITEADVAPDGEVALRRLTPFPMPPEAPFDRITMNWAMLRRSKTIVLVATGAQKREVLETAKMENYPDILLFPVAALERDTERRVDVLWHA
jgi:6-phosphogluconolactonase